MGDGTIPPAAFADYCARNMPEKFAIRCSEFSGYWAAERFVSMLRGVFEELDVEYREKNFLQPPDGAGAHAIGCSMAVALLTGQRLVTTYVGDTAAIMCLHTGQGLEVAIPHSRLDVAKTSVMLLGPEHLGLVLACRRQVQAFGGATAVANMMMKQPNRPRMVAGNLLDGVNEAVPPGGEIEEDSGMAICISFEVPEPLAVISSDNLEMMAKRPRMDPKLPEPKQVRLRHILMKHRDCKNPVDKVRGRHVVRSKAEAESTLRSILRECDEDATGEVFTKRCRELSECQSSLRGGNLAGDLAWVSRGKMGTALDEAAFALRVGHFSDLVDSDAGVHILWRTA